MEKTADRRKVRHLVRKVHHLLLAVADHRHVAIVEVDDDLDAAVGPFRFVISRAQQNATSPSPHTQTGLGGGCLNPSPGSRRYSSGDAREFAGHQYQVT